MTKTKKWCREHWWLIFIPIVNGFFLLYCIVMFLTGGE
jgi:hypothetical protein